VHVDGVRAYQRARRGETMELAARPVTIHQLTLLGFDITRGQLELEVHCSAGTYIRALARDLGAALGTGGTLASLRRTGALGFDLNDAVPWEALDPQALAAGAPLPALRSPLAALGHLAQQQLNAQELDGWRCGRQLQAQQPWPPGTAVVVTTPSGELAGVANASEDGTLQPKLVLDAAG
jgi:tRNA pseudouridine55 synthase